jgi:hypothetical protein
MVDAYNALGIAHGLAGRYDKAVTVFDAALALAPGSAQIVGNLGYALFRAGRLDEATQWLDRARNLDPDNARVQENLKLLARARLDGERRDGERQDETPPVASTPIARHNEVVVHRTSSYELITAESNEGALLRVAPNVYEVRGSIALASATGSSGPSATSATSASSGTYGAGGTVGASATSDTSATAATAATPGTSATVSHRIGIPVAGAEPVTASPPRHLPGSPAAAAAAVVATSPAVGVTRVSIRQAPSFQAPVIGLEVSNGVGKPHLAGGTARTYARYGWRTVRISDYRYFGVVASEIHYLEGHRESALALRATLPVPARLVPAATLHPGVNVRLVLGEDMVGRQVAVGAAVLSSAASPDMT